LVGAFVGVLVGAHEGAIEGASVRAQVGNNVGTLLGTFVGALVGALVGAEVGSGVNFKITGGFRGILHWLAVKDSNVKVPEAPTTSIARIATERIMVITACSNSLSLCSKCSASFL
jgi:phage tail tape-measure protein